MPRRTSIRSVPPGVAVASAVSMLAQPSVQQSSRQPFFPSRRESTTPNSTPGSAAAYSARPRARPRADLGERRLHDVLHIEREDRGHQLADDVEADLDGDVHRKDRIAQRAVQRGGHRRTTIGGLAAAERSGSRSGTKQKSSSSAGASA